MSDSTDQFFTEGDVAQDVSDAPAAPKGNDGAGGIKPPTFGMAVAIAAVALVLGFGIGYFTGMYIASNATATTAATSTGTTAAVAVQSEESEDASATGEDSSETSLPEGHPDLTQFMNEDGTVDEDAVAAYKAEHASQDADASETSADQGSEEPATSTTTE